MGMRKFDTQPKGLTKVFYSCKLDKIGDYDCA